MQWRGGGIWEISSCQSCCERKSALKTKAYVCILEPGLCNKKSQCNEKPACHRQRVAPAHPKQRKPACSNKDKSIKMEKENQSHYCKCDIVYKYFRASLKNNLPSKRKMPTQLSVRTLFYLYEYPPNPALVFKQEGMSYLSIYDCYLYFLLNSL